MATKRAGAEKTRPLDILGINEAEEKVYRWLLDQPGTSVAEVSKALSLPKNKVQRLLDTIESKGLTTHSRQQPRCYTPASPDIALKALMLRHQEELQRAEGVIRELQERAAVRQSGEQEQMIELINDREAERQAFEQLQLTAEHEVISLVRLPMRVSHLNLPPEKGQFFQRCAQSKGVRFRSVVDKEFLGTPGAIGGIRFNMAAGEEVRVCPHLPFKMLLADRRIAVIPLNLSKPDSPELLVRSSALLDALYALFEFFWERATPISFKHSDKLRIGNYQEWISEDMEKLLSLLATGMNDKKITYELKVSRSTYSRRIAEAMKILNAGSRFQLGWLAAERLSAKITERAPLHTIQKH